MVSLGHNELTIFQLPANLLEITSVTCIQQIVIYFEKKGFNFEWYFVNLNDFMHVKQLISLNDKNDCSFAWKTAIVV